MRSLDPAHLPQRVVEQNTCCDGEVRDAAPWVVVWHEGNWQCELHALPDAWRFHLYCGVELREVWACTGQPAFERAQELRDSFGARPVAARR